MRNPVYDVCSNGVIAQRAPDEIAMQHQDVGGTLDTAEFHEAGGAEILPQRNDVN
jgi:hypothetical protein